MKKEYIAPQTDVVLVLIESVMGNTDSDGLDDDFCAKGQGYDFFNMDDNDLWGTGSNDLWGDSED